MDTVDGRSYVFFLGPLDGVVGLVYDDDKGVLRNIVVPRSVFAEHHDAFRLKHGVQSAFISTSRYGPMLTEVSVASNLMREFLEEFSVYEV